MQFNFIHLCHFRCEFVRACRPRTPEGFIITQNPNGPPCFNYQNTGICRYGQYCRYSHSFQGGTGRPIHTINGGTNTPNTRTLRGRSFFFLTSWRKKSKRQTTHTEYERMCFWAADHGRIALPALITNCMRCEKLSIKALQVENNVVFCIACCKLTHQRKVYAIFGWKGWGWWDGGVSCVREILKCSCVCV